MELKEKTSLKDVDETMNLGIPILIIFLIVVLVPWAIGYYKGDLGSAVYSKGKVNFTLSRAIHYSPLWFHILSILAYLGLIIWILYDKNVFQGCIKTVFISILFFVLPVGYVSYYLVKPRTLGNYWITFVVCLAGTFVTALLYAEYNNFYPEDKYLHTLYEVSLTKSCFSIFITIVLLAIVMSKICKYKNHSWCNKFESRNKRLIWSFTDLFAIAEYAHFALFGTALYIFSNFPKLPNCE